MKRTNLIALLVATLFASACSSINLYTSPDIAGIKSGYITIYPEEWSSYRGITADLQFELQSSGYRVISYNAAVNDRQFIDNNHLYMVFITPHFYTSVDSIGIRRKHLSSITAEIEDTKSKEILLTARFISDWGPLKSSEFAEKLIKELNNLVK